MYFGAMYIRPPSTPSSSPLSPHSEPANPSPRPGSPPTLTHPRQKTPPTPPRRRPSDPLASPATPRCLTISPTPTHRGLPHPCPRAPPRASSHPRYSPPPTSCADGAVAVGDTSTPPESPISHIAKPCRETRLPRSGPYLPHKTSPPRLLSSGCRYLLLRLIFPPFWGAPPFSSEWRAARSEGFITVREQPLQECAAAKLCEHSSKPGLGLPRAVIFRRRQPTRL